MDIESETKRESANRRAVDRSRDELLMELAIRDALEKHRRENDVLYAPMIVKVIVFGMVALILSSVLIAFVALVVK